MPQPHPKLLNTQIKVKSESTSVKTLNILSAIIEIRKWNKISNWFAFFDKKSISEAKALRNIIRK